MTALADEHRLEAEHRRAFAREPERLSEVERQAVRRLAEDVPALWSAASTTARDRQAIARLMLERVAIRVHGTTERVELDCHWAGGTLTRHALTRPVRRFEQLEQWDRLIARITALREADATAQAIADRLNAEGWRPPKKAVFDAPMVRRLLQRRGLGTRRSPPDRLRLAAPRPDHRAAGAGRHPAHLARQPCSGHNTNQPSRGIMTKRSSRSSPS